MIANQRNSILKRSEVISLGMFTVGTAAVHMDSKLTVNSANLIQAYPGASSALVIAILVILILVIASFGLGNHKKS